MNSRHRSEHVRCTFVREHEGKCVNMRPLILSALTLSASHILINVILLTGYPDPKSHVSHFYDNESLQNYRLLEES